MIKLIIKRNIVVSFFLFGVTLGLGSAEEAKGDAEKRRSDFFVPEEFSEMGEQLIKVKEYLEKSSTRLLVEKLKKEPITCTLSKSLLDSYNRMLKALKVEARKLPQSKQKKLVELEIASALFDEMTGGMLYLQELAKKIRKILLSMGLNVIIDAQMLKLMSSTEDEEDLIITQEVQAMLAKAGDDPERLAKIYAQAREESRQLSTFFRTVTTKCMIMLMNREADKIKAIRDREDTGENKEAEE